MLKVEFRGLIEASDNKQAMTERDWIHWMSLDLIDHDTEMKVAEWFYVAACSPSFLTSGKLSKQEIVAVLTQEAFNERDLVEFAQKNSTSLNLAIGTTFIKKCPQSSCTRSSIA